MLVLGYFLLYVRVHGVSFIILKINWIYKHFYLRDKKMEIESEIKNIKEEMWNIKENLRSVGVALGLLMCVLVIIQIVAFVTAVSLTVLIIFPIFFRFTYRKSLTTLGIAYLLQNVSFISLICSGNDCSI